MKLYALNICFYRSKWDYQNGGTSYDGSYHLFETEKAAREFALSTTSNGEEVYFDALLTSGEIKGSEIEEMSEFYFVENFMAALREYPSGLCDVGKKEIEEIAQKIFFRFETENGYDYIECGN